MATPVNSVFEVQILYRCNGQLCRNIVHYANDAELAASPDQVALLFLQNFDSDTPTEFPGVWKTVLAPNATIVEMSVQPVYPVRWRKKITSLSVAGAGSALESEAQNLQASISKFGDLGDRHEVGAVRLGALGTDFYQNGMLTGPAKSLYVNLASFLLNPKQFVVNGQNAVMNLRIANRGTVVVGGVPVIRITGSSPVREMLVQDELRTQRTRNIGKGE